MEVVAFTEVLDKPGMCRLPAQQRAGQRARARVVAREEAGQEAEVRARLAGRDGDHRDVEVSPDPRGDGADRHTLVRDRVQRRSRRCFLQGQAEQVSRIEPVYGGPAAGAVADEARDSLVTGNTDQGREESVIPRPVTGRSKSHNRKADAQRSERQRDLLPGSVETLDKLGLLGPDIHDAGSMPATSQ